MTHPSPAWIETALGTNVSPHRSPTQESSWRRGNATAAIRAAEAFANRAAAAILTSTARLGCAVRVDGASVLAERALHTDAFDAGASSGGPVRSGSISRNGTTRFVACADGWVSFTMSRADDHDLLPACFEGSFHESQDSWERIAELAATLPSVHLRNRATLVGLSCAIPDEHASLPFGVTDVTVFEAPRQSPSFDPHRPVESHRLHVVDLSALWAGPLCAHLLHQAGCDVSFLEDPTRPDGTRIGAPSFFTKLHVGHTAVGIDVRSGDGVQRLRMLLATADVVITSARSRAFAQMGIDPHKMMLAHPIRAWISITGFGPTQPNRIGFGDDAAVAGGLWDSTHSGPVFTADAVADPLTGLAATALATHALATGTRVHLEVSLAGVASLAAGQGNPK